MTLWCCGCLFNILYLGSANWDKESDPSRADSSALLLLVQSVECFLSCLLPFFFLNLKNNFTNILLFWPLPRPLRPHSSAHIYSIVYTLEVMHVQRWHNGCHANKSSALLTGCELQGNFKVLALPSASNCLALSYGHTWPPCLRSSIFSGGYITAPLTPSLLCTAGVRAMGMWRVSGGRFSRRCSKKKKKKLQFWHQYKTRRPNTFGYATGETTKRNAILSILIFFFGGGAFHLAL